MDALQPELGAWDAWAAALQDAMDVMARLAAVAEILAAQEPAVQERDALVRLRKQLAAQVAPVLCIRDAARFEAQSCAAAAPQAEALAESAQA